MGVEHERPPDGPEAENAGAWEPDPGCRLLLNPSAVESADSTDCRTGVVELGVGASQQHPISVEAPAGVSLGSS